MFGTTIVAIIFLVQGDIHSNRVVLHSSLRLGGRQTHQGEKRPKRRVTPVISEFSVKIHATSNATLKIHATSNATLSN